MQGVSGTVQRKACRAPAGCESGVILFTVCRKDGAASLAISSFSFISNVRNHATTRLDSNCFLLTLDADAGNAFWSSATPASVTLVWRRSSDCRLFSPASSFSPASVTLVLVKVQRLQALQPGQLLQPRVRHLRAAKVQRLQALQPGQLLQPRVRTLPFGKGPAFAGSSVRPVPSAPRPSPS